MLSRSSVGTLAPPPGPSCGTQSRLSCAAVLLTHGALPIPTVVFVVFVCVMVGVAPQVTAMRHRFVRLVNWRFGPMMYACAPAGGGVMLSRSAGRNPYCGAGPSLARSTLCMRAVGPLILAARAKT